MVSTIEKIDTPAVMVSTIEKIDTPTSIFQDAVMDIARALDMEYALYGVSHLEIIKKDGKAISIRLVTEKELQEAQYGQEQIRE